MREGNISNQVVILPPLKCSGEERRSVSMRFDLFCGAEHAGKAGSSGVVLWLTLVGGLSAASTCLVPRHRCSLCGGGHGVKDVVTLGDAAAKMVRT